MTSIDHLPVAALTLEEGVDYVRRSLGVDLPFGGKHQLMGTHNHLMRIGEGIFLEIIAPDPLAMPQRPRWFCLDDKEFCGELKTSPRLVTWVIRTGNLTAALQKVNGIAGEAITVSRGSLTWRISVPQDGSMAFQGAFPTLIEWPEGPHPSLNMTDLGCRFDHLRIEHPASRDLAAALAPVFSDNRVSFSEGEKPRLIASFTTPTGTRVLS
jgi:hypothetical protein